MKYGMISDEEVFCVRLLDKSFLRQTIELQSDLRNTGCRISIFPKGQIEIEMRDGFQ